MMNKKTILTLATAICTLGTGCNSDSNEKALYKNDTYTIYENGVKQGKHEAKVLSDTSMSSTYVSPAMEHYSRKIEFKFSLNHKDNELPYGKNHSVVIQPENGVYRTPVITFGDQTVASKEGAEENLEKNTKVTFRLDMTPVLESFEEKGYYEDLHGERIGKEDFQGVYIAGGSAPLYWDFENLRTSLEDPDGDGVFEVTLVMNTENPDGAVASQWTLENDIADFPQFQTDYPLLNSLYKLTLDEVIKLKEADGTFRTGKKWAGVWTRDVSYSIVLGLGAVEPERSMTSLRKKVKRNRIIQDTGSGGAWPVSTDRTTWALAAWELYKVTGDQEWLREAYEIIKNTVEDDLKSIVASDGLVLGETSFLDWRKQEYPRWMDNVAISQSEGLGTNVVHYATWNILGQMASILGEPSEKYLSLAEGLKKAINEELWLEDRGYYAMYKYGGHYPLLSERSEALGEALAVLYDVASPERQQEVVSSTPTVVYGVPCFYPQITGIQPYHNNGIWPFVQSFYNLAAAKVGNGKALEHGLGSIYRASALFLTNKENMVADNGDFVTELNSDYQLWSVAGHLGMVYKIFFGMDFQPDQVTFSPAIPKAYKGNKTLKGFKYRDAILDIEVKGYGKNIKSFKIDGKETAPLFKGDQSGRHTIEIVMDNEDISKGQSITLVENAHDITAPVLKWEDGKLKWNAVEGVKQYSIYRNGELLKETSETELAVSLPSVLEEYTIRVKDSNGYWSLMSEPVKLYKPEAAIILEAESIGKTTGRSLVNFTGKGAVEISKQQHKQLSWNVDVPQAGKYFIDFRYANGNGTWNSDNKCAIRTLKVNGEAEGTVVMAQRGVDEWSSWAYTNAIVVTLKKGRNQINLSFEPHNENMNVEVNAALIDHLRILPQ
ncbi:CBM35 domain-containing protein [Algivirga pacifica]|uniref:CBM6 domain-containing protein n=1 Tax=Algivirga pacifica TaxID=1162670 RepID=A0ABP9DCN2_9BACT